MDRIVASRAAGSDIDILGMAMHAKAGIRLLPEFGTNGTLALMGGACRGQGTRIG